MNCDVQAIVSSTLNRAKQNNFAGYDPFDGLNAGFFDLCPKLKPGMFGLAWTQLNKRSPINVRPLFATPKKRNPKGVALFILGLIEDYLHHGDTSFLDTAYELADWLLDQQCDQKIWQHSCWGYHFDWKARAFFVPKGKPNVITTVYVAQALFALSEISQNLQYREAALNSADFMVNRLFTQVEGQSFFAYIPGETTFVHNANLWAAAWVGKVATLTDNDTYKTLALTAARSSVAAQGSDGSWMYGTRHHHQFIDGFHTGYNLEALTLLSEALKTNEFSQALELGLHFYKMQLFEPDGTAKYFSENQYPLDMHSVSQAILTLIKVGNSRIDFTFVDKVIVRAIDSMYIAKEQRFIYQKNKWFSNNVDYIRWTQAWVYYSFSLYCRAKSDILLK
ncbi:aspartate-semialdehyde dehydrogenase [Pseudoalteromonas sp. MMG010]|uniref:aspartate-semialdehyde dehydrogenase n=1 Tax=Pseudoalteromonas sp. MMG010 TaxID=2822685 RepID=UPI001B3A4034|nr:aspartate-semialdehyde dehydrogenase [Pseudoalteromonas sp. MMG010]MBQ4834139.1 aspartate-semialdehyde dehydrogenase [Pseudoalteromonas sp. MMG010]